MPSIDYRHRKRSQHNRAAKHRPPESEKISELVRKEGMPQKQAVATALNMKRSGRLGPHGEYHRSAKRGRRRSYRG